MPLSILFKSTSYALAPTDDVVLFTTGSSALAGTLPTAVGIAGKTLILKKVDAGTGAVTVGTTSSQMMDADHTFLLSTQWQRLKVFSDGSNWQVSGSN